MKNLILATKNKGKVREIEESLAGFGYKILSLAAFSNFDDIEETGHTFEENAGIKAQKVFEHFKILSLADDSGLEVDSLGGAPGIHSARYSGENATDQSNCLKLLEEMKKAGDKNRTARFRCVMALYDGKEFRYFEGKCEGTLLKKQRGSDGFGYDPLFVPNGFEKTFAELDLRTKNHISHRGRALSALKVYFNTI